MINERKTQLGFSDFVFTAFLFFLPPFLGAKAVSRQVSCWSEKGLAAWGLPLRRGSLWAPGRQAGAPGKDGQASAPLRRAGPSFYLPWAQWVPSLFLFHLLSPNFKTLHRLALRSLSQVSSREARFTPVLASTQTTTLLFFLHIGFPHKIPFESRTEGFLALKSFI